MRRFIGKMPEVVRARSVYGGSKPLNGEAIMRFRTTGLLLLGALTIEISANAQSTPTPSAVTRTMVVAAKLPICQALCGARQRPSCHQDRDPSAEIAKARLLTPRGLCGLWAKTRTDHRVERREMSPGWSPAKWMLALAANTLRIAL